ncbi:MAG TPA: DUF2238 domain-containing protein [Chromobacteriaceae bacterium]|nr:DUF2238 domain-containing protein [Chromobacteriaceae bacterium]
MPLTVPMPARPWLPFGGALLVMLWSVVRPHDYPTWWLEAIPALIGLPVVWWLWPRFAWSRLAVWMMALHACILLVGAHYTYAQVPLGFWVQDALGLARNHYDRLGHLAQGAIPAILAREVLARRTHLRGGWLGFLTTCFCLALSALYELIEWWTAVALGAGADAFLATQGDPWDTQWDMFCALIGSVASQFLFYRCHNRQLAELANTDLDSLETT